MKASLERGEVTTLPTVNTIADGTAVKTPGSNIFPYIQKNIDEIFTVSDDELVVAFLDMVENHKMVVENSGLLTVAALKHLNVEGKKIVLLGTGGAATAIAVQAALDKASEIAIFNRKDEFFANGEKTVEKIKKAVPSMKKIYIEDIDDEKKLGEAIAGSDLLINATRAGMSPLENVLPVPEELLHKDLAVADVVYNPRETLLIKKAKEAGCKAAVGGIGMLLWQGAAAFELFTGKEMPAQEVMELFFS